MLAKAVLTFVGRVVGIAAVIASPLIARAEPPATDHHAKDHARARSSKRVRHHGHAVEQRKAPRAAAEAMHDGEPSPEVVIEKTSTKRAPRPSATPLPTIAAAASRPLAQPDGASTGSPQRGLHKDDMRHAVEPMRTPIVMTTRPKKKAKPPCLSAPIDVTRGTETESFPLTKCDGTAAPLAVEEMSILVRPGSAPKPADPIADLAKKPGEEIAPGIKRIDPRLVERLQLVVDHFAKDGKETKLFVVSGYRPTSKGSFHATGRAIDFRMEGVENTDLVTFCKTLPDTGCGFYPNSSFIHLDVRDPGAGHVSWIDASSAGEKPTYVATWPPPPKEHDDVDAMHLLARLDDLQLLPPTPATDEEEEREDVKPPVKPAAASLSKKMDDGDEK